MSMMVERFVEDMTYQVEEFVEENFTRTNAGVCGLDIRAGYEVFINDEALVVRKSRLGSLDYYGGFEYVDADGRVELGEYVFFFAAFDERVQKAVSAGMDNLAVQEEAA